MNAVFGAVRAQHSPILFAAAPAFRHRGLRRPHEAGFTYIGLLVLVAMMGVALTLVSELWQTGQKREKEQELLFIGNQFRRAIALYGANGGGYPRQLEDLVKDPRFAEARRYLRKLYADPITGRAEWGLVKAEGNAIMGVHSLSDAEPLKQSGFSLADQGFERKKKYSEWVFVVKAAQAPPAATVGAGAQASGAVTASPAAPAPAGAITPANPGTTATDGGQQPSGRVGPRARR